MKNITYLITLVFLIVLLGCKENSSSNNSSTIKVAPNEAQVKQILDDPILTNDWKNNIQLDGTKKWQANEETNQGVINMINILEDTKVGPEMDFKNLGTKLKSEINVIIKKCSMKGDSHENLHIFLMPLIEKVNALQEENDIEKNKALVASIYHNLTAYSTYFK